jgi:hypothetical protein
VLGGLVLLTYFALGNRTPNAEGEGKKGKANVDALTIELRLPKDEYKSSESVDVEIIFRNNGSRELKLAMTEEPKNEVWFFDFLIVGDRGTTYVTNYGEGWRTPDPTPVKMMRLAPKGTHRVRLKNVLPLGAHCQWVPDTQEQYKILVIYRDHSYGHAATYEEFGKDGPTVWKGIAISAPVTIKQITYVEKDK